MASTDIDTALRNAVVEGKLAETTRLLDSGANVNTRIAQGELNTPLHCAVARGHEKVVELLVARGAKLESRNSVGETAIHLAIRHDYPKLTEWLLQNGSSWDETDREENTALHKAAFLGRSQHCAILLKYGADRDEVNENQQTAYDLAKSDDTLEVLKSFVQPAKAGMTFTVNI